MSAAAPTPQERARKAHVTVLRALQEPGRQVALATALGVSESTVSRFKTEQLEQLCAFLAHLGMKIVPSTHRCIDPKTFDAFEVLFSKAMSMTTPARLIFEDTEMGGCP
ncbi:AsnC family protein [Pseudorhodoferax sp.]|uniref:AsnC family protein n=1 Tax=Pseudorhodoferax sp. TaxID=1993553 RepID=UPI0039E709D9